MVRTSGKKGEGIRVMETDRGFEMQGDRGGRKLTGRCGNKDTQRGTSLLVQWLRIHLPMQGT